MIFANVSLDSLTRLNCVKVLQRLFPTSSAALTSRIMRANCRETASSRDVTKTWRRIQNDMKGRCAEVKGHALMQTRRIQRSCPAVKKNKAKRSFFCFPGGIKRGQMTFNITTHKWDD